MKGFLLGVVFTAILLAAGAYGYLRFGHPPVAVTDRAFPYEAELVHVPLGARIHRDTSPNVPLEPNSTNLQMGAHIYREQCAACHGLYGRPSPFAAHMYPPAPQLWKPHANGVVGVSDDPAPETYWKVTNGLRLTGMPAYKDVLNETQRWQVTLLLANADKPLPADALNLLKQPLSFDPPNPAETMPLAPKP